jgi:hypothetical protein
MDGNILMGWIAPQLQPGHTVTRRSGRAIFEPDAR